MPIDTPKAMASYPLAFHEALRCALQQLGHNPEPGAKGYGYIAAGSQELLQAMRRNLKAFLRGARERFDSSYRQQVADLRFHTTLTRDYFGEWELELVATRRTQPPLTEEKILQVLSQNN